MNLLNSLVLGVTVAALGLSGCAATGNGGNVSKVGLEQLMNDSAAASANGMSEKSMDLLSKAAKEFPTRKEPWLRMAQAHFEAHQYGPAILSAEEVLQRDEKDLLAKSILAVSGLRVSARALAKLREDQVITGDVRLEARMLARTLRDTLGESDLFAASAKPVADEASSSGERSRKHPVAKRFVRTASSSAVPSISAAKAAGSEAASNAESGNPFGALK